MSTRACYRFIDPDPTDPEVVTVYKHSDGHPDGAVCWITKALEHAWPLPRMARWPLPCCPESPPPFFCGVGLVQDEAQVTLHLDSGEATICRVCHPAFASHLEREALAHRLPPGRRKMARPARGRRR
jgi:hypothetical protein